MLNLLQETRSGNAFTTTNEKAVEHVRSSASNDVGVNPKPFKGVGFTLIELLVVIAIISLLSSVVLASLSNARARARDTRRLTDMRQIQTALELYYSANGEYPDVASYDLTGNGWVESHSSTEWQNFAAALSSYVDLPTDSVNDWPLTYYYRTATYGGCPDYDGDSYLMLFATEVSSFDLPEYSTQGEGNSAHRYCIYP